MTKIAIIGANSMLGKCMYELFRNHYDTIGTYHSNSSANLINLDITSPVDYRNFLNSQNPDIIIHNAASTDLEWCENNPVEAENINVKPLETLVDWVYNKKKKIVFISTDGVFDGKKGDYSENDMTNPINVYGMNKLVAEKIVSKADNSLILRVAVLYSGNNNHRKNKKFLESTIEKLRGGKTVDGATDIIRSPTLTDDIAYAAMKLLEKDAHGIYHVAGSTSLSMFDAAQKIAQIFGFDNGLIKPIANGGIKSIVPRPKNCSLNCKKLYSENITMRSFDEGIKYVKESM